jgi:hypothetical protein
MTWERQRERGKERELEERGWPGDIRVMFESIRSFMRLNEEERVLAVLWAERRISLTRFLVFGFAIRFKRTRLRRRFKQTRTE